ncbi:unnamed protein product [Calypogeia fissa]
MIKFFVIASILFSVASANPIGLQWKQTLFEFWNNPALPNWIIDSGTSYPGGAPNWGTGEIETYTNLNYAITSDQALAITPRKAPDGSWTSSRLESVGDFTCTPGGKLWVEAELKLGAAPESQQQGIWPAFWALGSKFRGVYTNWPEVSEWDFFESINGIPTMYMTIHCGVDPGGPCDETTGIQGTAAIIPGQWHRVAFEVDRSMSGPGQTGTWLDETLNWYLDEVLVFSVTGARVNDQAAWEQLAHQPHFLLMNVAVGGAFPNAIAGGTTPTAATIDGPSVGMEVFYVGVWNWF